ncbi:MAG TPA: hypothetical protein VNB94_00265 [Mycobacteriales bacterium]|nr:hypothetical protein [Mycobacteriales bacterium]
MSAAEAKKSKKSKKISKPKRTEPVGTFDRVRPRSAAASVGEPLEIEAAAPSTDADGTRRLYSTVSSSPVLGAVTLECSSCGVESAMTLARLLRASIPSIHLPVIKGRYPSYLRCPSCGRRTWMRAHFRV